MEKTTVAHSIGSLCDSGLKNRKNNKKGYKEFDELFKTSFYDQYFTSPLTEKMIRKIQRARMYVQLKFSFFSTLRTIVKEKIKKVKIKIKKVILSTQLCCNF